tara:strand:- start:138 stop:899 length:762 start_codon:yes stop_codon:yes gene_type:complete
MNYPAVVNLSLPKTGSTTIYSYFKAIGACHEGLHEKTVDLIIDYREGNISLHKLKKLILRRQNYLNASIDSSTFLHLIAEEIVNIYPQCTKYLTVLRDPLEWTKSYLGMLYQFGKNIEGGSASYDSGWAARYGIFQAAGLDPVFLFKNIHDNDYLKYVSQNLIQFWIDSELRIFDSVPSERLYVFRIEDLDQALKKISEIICADASIMPFTRKFNVSTTDTIAKEKIHHCLQLSYDLPLTKESLTLYKYLIKV